MDKFRSAAAEVISLEAANCAHCSRSYARRIADSRETICPPCRRQLHVLSEAIARDRFIAHLLDFDIAVGEPTVRPVKARPLGQQSVAQGEEGGK